MDALLQGVEVQALRPRHHDLAIEHAAFGQGLVQRLFQLREVAVQGLLVAALDEGLVAAKHQGAEAVPLGLEQEAGRIGQCGCVLGQHGLNGWGGGLVGGHQFMQIRPAMRPASTIQWQPPGALSARQRPITSAPGFGSGPLYTQP